MAMSPINKSSDWGNPNEIGTTVLFGRGDEVKRVYEAPSVVAEVKLAQVTGVIAVSGAPA